CPGPTSQRRSLRPMRRRHASRRARRARRRRADGPLAGPAPGGALSRGVVWRGAAWGGAVWGGAWFLRVEDVQAPRDDKTGRVTCGGGRGSGWRRGGAVSDGAGLVWRGLV